MAKRSQDQIRAQIITGLDIIAEYKELGVRFDAEKPRANGKIACFARGREEKRASAYVDTLTGTYGDRGANETLSIFDFAASYGQFQDWRAARDHYAAKAGIKISTRKKIENPLDVLDFKDWSPGEDMLVRMWCMKHKPGTTLEAVKAFGGRIAFYKCWTDEATGERHRGRNKCIALPCYAHNLLAAPAVAWVIWDIGGALLEVYKGKGQPPEYVKMKSIGPTYGTLMNVQALEQLSKPIEQRKVELAWKTAGPTDAMAIWSTISPEQRDTSVVTCNASGETGDVPSEIAAHFTGLRVYLVGDADSAGEMGIKKWFSALRTVASETRQIRLPYAVEKKSGKDLRYFINERNSTCLPAPNSILPTSKDSDRPTGNLKSATT